MAGFMTKSSGRIDDYSAVQVNGKLRDQIELPVDIDEAGARRAAEAAKRCRSISKANRLSSSFMWQSA
jgi:hypothetical protein